jgi:DNA-binding transcriptional LysR family regulator
VTAPAFHIAIQPAQGIHHRSMLPDIDSLALFVRAADLKSLTLAAEAAHMSLGAASRRIALLEDRFKTTLFERSPRGVVPTPAGASLLPFAKSLLVQMNQMQAEMTAHGSGRKGALVVLANTSAMTESLPRELAEFSELHPEIRLSVEERWSAEIMRAVRAAEADLGIVIEGHRMEGLESHPYGTDDLALVLPHGHPLTAMPDVAFKEALDYDIVSLEGASSLVGLLREQAMFIEKPVNLHGKVRSFEAVCKMVQAGFGIGVLPYQAVEELATGMGLEVRRLREAWARRRMLLCVRKDRVPSKSLDVLLEHLGRTA